MELDDCFPDPRVWDAYKYPVVDIVRERFIWKKPDIEMLKRYMWQTVGWNEEKVLSLVNPIFRNQIVKQPVVEVNINRGENKRKSSTKELTKKKLKKTDRKQD